MLNTRHLELIVVHEASVHKVVQLGEPLLDPEADGPQHHAVGQQHVPGGCDSDEMWKD